MSSYPSILIEIKIECVTSVVKTNNKELIEETLQSLSERNDGTLLLTAFPTLLEVKKATKEIDKKVFEPFLASLEKWEKMGCNEINYRSLKYETRSNER